LPADATTDFLRLKNSGFIISDQFPDFRKLIEMPSKSRKDRGYFGFPDVRKTKKVIDYDLIA
jgi:hypothetical protein